MSRTSSKRVHSDGAIWVLDSHCVEGILYVAENETKSKVFC